VNNSNDQISALMDGELEAHECELVVRRLANDDSLKQSWGRYHLVRACLLKEYAGSHDIYSRVRAAVDDESVQHSVAPARHSWLKTSLGGAMAASVALVAVIGLNTRLEPPAESDFNQAVAPGFVSQSTALDRQFNRQAQPVGLGGLSGDSSQYATPSQLAAKPFTEPRARIQQYSVQAFELNTQASTFTPLAPAGVQSIPTGNVRGEVELPDRVTEQN